jgi:hypothetical protein
MPVKQTLIGAAFLGMAILDLVIVLAAAQSPDISQTAHGAPQVVQSLPNANGGAIVAELAKPVSARKNKLNDKIECNVTMALLLHGKIALPRGTKIFGHITDSRTRSKEVPESVVKIDFDRAVLKDGREIPLVVTIQALGTPMQSSATNYTDLDAVNQTGLQPPLGINGMRRMQATAFPGSHRPANAEAGGSAPDTGALRRDGPALGPLSQGVIGMKGISLSSASQGSAISSTHENIRLRSGTQLVLHFAEPQALLDSLAGTKN